MVSSARQAMACILVIFSFAVLARAQTGPVKEATASVSGKVTIKGKGVPGVVVSVRPNESQYRRELFGSRAVTDANGEYRIVNIPPGNYLVKPITPTLVSADGHEYERSLIINKGETVEHFDFAMVRGGVITGKVVDADGRPLIEEAVSLFTVPGNERFYLMLGAYTDDRGVYRIFGLRPGRYKVAAGREDSTFNRSSRAPFGRTYYPAAIDPAEATVIEVNEGTEATDINITLSRPTTTYTASGRIIDAETGRAMPNVGYGITRYYDQNSSGSTNAGERSNANGEFKLKNLVPGRYSVSITPEPDSDWRVEDTRFEIVDQDVTNLVVRTIKSGSISGVVVVEGTEDKAVREYLSKISLAAWVRNEADQPLPGASTIVNADGTFRVRGLASGIAMFHLHSNDGLRLARVERNGVIQPRGIEIKERENITGVRLVVHLGNASLRGKIEVENGPLPPDGRFFIWLRRIGEDPNSQGTEARPQLDERGRFLLENMFAGAYEVNAGVFLTSSNKMYAAKKQQVVVTAGSNGTLNVTVDLNSQPTIVRQ